MSSAGCLIGDNLQLLCSAAAEASGAPRHSGKQYRLIIRQQPERSRVGSISEKVDRRPIDPPPIIQLVVQDPLDPFSHTFATNPGFIMQAVLMDETGETTLRYIKGHRATAMAGLMVSPLHTLRDTSMAQGAYFVFSDLSVRMEGSFRLRFELFENNGDMVHNRASIISDTFCVYSPKRFPGMMESTRLSKIFAEQGLRIRIRTEAGTKKRGRKQAASSRSTKKAKLSEPFMPPINNILDITRTTGELPAPSPTSTFAYNMVGNINDTRGSDLFSFRHEPFHAESSQDAITTDQQRFNFEHAFKTDSSTYSQRPPMNSQPLQFYSPASEEKSHLHDTAKASHGFDLNDIAAVALLDSLSNGGATKQHLQNSSQSSSSYMQLLSPIGCGGGISGSIPAVTSGAMLPIGSSSINIENELQSFTGGIHAQKQQHYHHTGYNKIGEMPFSNYHLTATHTPERERQNHPQNPPTFEHSLLFGQPSRPYAMLRSNAAGLCSPNAHGGASAETYVLQAPQQLYTSQTRGTAINGNSTNANSILDQQNSTPKHSWSSSLPGISIQLPQSGFVTSNTRSDYSGTLA